MHVVSDSGGSAAPPRGLAVGLDLDEARAMLVALADQIDSLKNPADVKPMHFGGADRAAALGSHTEKATARLIDAIVVMHAELEKHVASFSAFEKDVKEADVEGEVAFEASLSTLECIVDPSLVDVDQCTVPQEDS